MASRAARRQACRTVRTLCPRTSPTSNTSRTSRSARGNKRRGGRRAVENHQVDVAVGGHVATAITAVGHDRDVADEPLGTGLAEVLQGILDQFQDHGIAQIAVQRAKLDPRAAGRMPGLEVLVAFCQPRLGGQHVGAKHRGRARDWRFRWQDTKQVLGLGD